KIEKIEPSNLVGAIVGAIPRTDTPVISHLIQAFVAVSRCTNRTNRLTRRLFAVLAQHRFKKHLWLIQIALVVSVNAKPLHLASSTDLILPDNRNVVLSLACNHACVTADARAQIDRHSPRIISLRKFRIQTEFPWR